MQGCPRLGEGSLGEGWCRGCWEGASGILSTPEDRYTLSRQVMPSSLAIADMWLKLAKARERTLVQEGSWIARAT